jgi:hypothetical protein
MRHIRTVAAFLKTLPLGKVAFEARAPTGQEAQIQHFVASRPLGRGGRNSALVKLWFTSNIQNI